MKNLTKAKFVLAISLIGLIGIPRTEAKPYGKLLKIIPYVITGAAGMGAENVRARTAPCTNLVRNFNKQRNSDLKRLAYKRRNGEDTQFLINGMGYRREEYEHLAFKKGCSSIDGRLNSNVHSSVQSIFNK